MARSISARRPLAGGAVTRARTASWSGATVSRTRGRVVVRARWRARGANHSAGSASTTRAARRGVPRSSAHASASRGLPRAYAWTHTTRPRWSTRAARLRGDHPGASGAPPSRCGGIDTDVVFDRAAALQARRAGNYLSFGASPLVGTTVAGPSTAPSVRAATTKSTRRFLA